MKLREPREKKCAVFRYELKYLITRGDAEILKKRLGGLLQKDAHALPSGAYKIRSIYFDDYWHSSYQEKMAGTLLRKKYRLRIYNDRDDAINLERKLKYGSLISKQSALLNRTEVEMLLDGEYGFLLKHPQQLCREFYCECTSKLMRPRVTVDYEREAYIFSPGDVRITFDMNLRAALLKFDLFDAKLPTLGVLDNGEIILEVKYTEFMPNLIKKVLPQRTSQLLAVSKYILVCDKVDQLSKPYWSD